MFDAEDPAHQDAADQEDQVFDAEDPAHQDAADHEDQPEVEHVDSDNES